MTYYLRIILHVPLAPISFPAGQCCRHRRHRRREAGPACLPGLPLPSNRLAPPRLLQACRPNQAALLPAAPAFRFGDYVLGDENCPFLYGPTDVRY